MIRTKCVYSPINRTSDGLRILATRIRGRGLKKSRYDVWMANLAPSETLLRAIQRQRISWATFSRRYKQELWEGGTIDKRNLVIKNHGQKFTLRLLQRIARDKNITVLCHCSEGQRECHRYLLKNILRRKI